ncbi:FAD-dependent oxidoreductase [Paraburkholderia bryophila]|uniref:flavin monoamine oxidase family protein n=1 Tax=Paraburkholderia bryophila TaxID=420952 RepID=UPI00234B0C64|nr:FAD-dependent oxidoreductase [Paraburkholderia bryophila]WCM24975.1 FAD-dependent oxidoreductase [Paraburkholderia bryophila]
MTTARIAIVGAGLSGLYAACLLEQAGFHDYVIIEARETPGGRIASVSALGERVSDLSATTALSDQFDLGPTWFWPSFQHQLQRLVDELGLGCFEQFETGHMMVERSHNDAATRVRGYANSPPSMRLLGGMGTLIAALQRKLDAARIFTGQAVRRLRRGDSHVELDGEDENGHVSTWRVEHVLLAVPPRLAATTIEFSPGLPPELIRQWRATATWMAPHAKYLAVYDTPFWREQGLSGEARSAAGPLGEIHDASLPGSSAALFGFFGVPASVRMKVPDDVLYAHCRAQLLRLFGPRAATPKAEMIKDWAQDPYTATAADLDAAASHGEAPATAATAGPWRDRLTGIASEWSPQFPGYVAGSIEAASLGVVALQQLVGRGDSAR